MISLAQDDGAAKDILKLGTHGRGRRDAIDSYTTLEWETICREVAKLRVQRREPKVIAMPKAAAAGGAESDCAQPSAQRRAQHAENGNKLSSLGRWRRRESNPPE